jgi:hypothetical protein
MVWQVQVYGRPKPDLAAWCEEHGIPLHVFRMAIQVRESWAHTRYAISGAAGYVHWPGRPLELGRDPSPLLGHTRNADWVGRKAGSKSRKCWLKDHFDRLIVTPLIAAIVTCIPRKAIGPGSKTPGPTMTNDLPEGRGEGRF